MEVDLTQWITFEISMWLLFYDKNDGFKWIFIFHLLI